MQLKILGQTFEYRNDLAELEAVFQQILNMITEADKQFSHLVIDGVEVYSDFETYIAEKIHSIHTIDVVAITMDEYIRDVFQTMYSYLTRALPEIERLIDEFYHAPSENTWNRFEQMLEGVQWINKVLYLLVENPKNPLERQVLAHVRKTLEERLRQLLEAVETEDTILIADIIQYEIMPLLKEMMEQVKVNVIN
jgi:hypothetical protein